ncbi:MBL fold metallo-hydrolase [Streptomyces sp. NBC_00378]|uniref:MBL fold metallo-hydrolase n=1 Tax=unclassified Streptomyces TaxID=2593676 RepID=UPI0022501FCE|nr:MULTISPECIES: MBL fold metallo-hydrolase [unclassified Streptomyces]MCX5115092.1 MBL fold metallo-hydrolase [Streptomyces sp. NBC_00378]
MHAATDAAGAIDSADVTDVIEVAEGVHAYVQGAGGWCLNNAGILTDGGHSALIDTAATESRARRLRRAALALAPRPPRAVVNTHFHGDHTYGNFVFPEALTIGHERTRTMVRAAGLHMAGLWPDVCWGDIEITPPELTFRDRTTLHVGTIRAELIHIGPAAHTTDDTIVWLPDQGVLFTGDLVMNGVTPFCVMGSVTGSLRALEQLRALGATTVVPGHGPVGGPEILDVNEAYLRRIRQLAKEGTEAGATPLELARTAGPGPYAHLLDSERLLPNLHRGYAEEQGLPEGSPLDVPALFAEMAEYHGRPPECLA